MPLAKDHGRERNVAITRRHVVVEAVTDGCTNGEVGSTKPGQSSREHSVQEPRTAYIDTHGGGGVRMLATGSQPQTPAGTEQSNGQEHDHHVHEVRENRLVEKHRSDDRDVAQKRDLDIRQANRRGVQLRTLRKDRREEEACQTKSEHVEHHTDDDLIHVVAHSEEGENRTHRRAS